MAYRPSTAHALHSFYIQDRPYFPCSVAARFSCHHNITHSPCTSTCTTHPTLHILLPSTTLLGTQLITRHSWQHDTVGMVKVLWCHSHLVWLVFEGSISTCADFCSGNLITSIFGPRLRHFAFCRCPLHNYIHGHEYL